MFLSTIGSVLASCCGSEAKSLGIGRAHTSSTREGKGSGITLRAAPNNSS
jgi:hypothetical protein